MTTFYQIFPAVYGWSSQAEAGGEEKDVYETLIENSGCSKFHFPLQDCYFEHNDWKKCQEEMAEFKQCMSEHGKQKKKGTQEQR